MSRLAASGYSWRVLTVVVHEKGGQTQRFSFKGDSFSIGREDDNDLVLDRVNVSKHHLQFVKIESRVDVVDLESTNGTYLNGRKVQAPRPVRRTDRVYVGDYILMLEGDDALLALAARDADKRRGGTSPGARPGELVEDDTGLVTSAQRVAAAGIESSYLDGLAAQIHQTLLKAVPRLDPNRPVFYRFSPPTQIIVRPSVRERRYNKSPSNLGAVFEYLTGDRGGRASE